MTTGCFVCTKKQETPAPTKVEVKQETLVKKELVIKTYTVSSAAVFEFDSDQVESDPTDNKEMDKLLSDITNYPDARVIVEGHSDNIGTEEYNKALSERRAQTVADKLAKSGKIKNKIEIVGMGTLKPLASNETAEGRAQNRRVDVILLKKEAK